MFHAFHRGAGSAAATRQGMAAPSVGNALRGFATALMTWHQRRVSLREAMSLDDRMLDDVGLTRADLRRSGYFDCWGR